MVKDWFCDGCAVAPRQDSVLHPHVEYGGQKFDWVDSQVYLGCKFVEGGELDAEISRRIALAWVAFKSLRCVFRERGPRGLGLGTVSQLFNVVVGTVLLYGSEVWALTGDQLKRLEAFRTARLRVALQGRQHDSTEACADVRVPTVKTLLARRQLRWLGHLARHPDDSWSKMMLTAEVASDNPGWNGRVTRCTGTRGAYNKLVTKHLKKTDTARSVFKKAWEAATRRQQVTGRLANAPWCVLAGFRGPWRKFCNSVTT